MAAAGLPVRLLDRGGRRMTRRHPPRTRGPRRRPRSGGRPLGPAGLVVGVVQDVADGRVLMVGWLDVEALAATLGTGEVHFHSRSRGRLWRKGESSGQRAPAPLASRSTATATRC